MVSKFADAWKKETNIIPEFQFNKYEEKKWEVKRDFDL